MKDPKTGYHWIWINPLALCVICYDKITSRITKYKKQQYINRLLKENPDLQEILKLAGTFEKVKK